MQLKSLVLSLMVKHWRKEQLLAKATFEGSVWIVPPYISLAHIIVSNTNALKMILFTSQVALLAHLYFINIHKQEQYTCSNK